MRTTKILLSAILFMGFAIQAVHAAAPISGQTLAFDTAPTAIGDTTNTVNALAAADFDNDGDPDVVSGDAGGALTLWTNAGGSWSSTTVGTAAAAVNALAVADFDNDGAPDVLSGDAGGALTLWQNTGGSWSSTSAGSGPVPVNALGVSDLEGDGDLDVVSGSGDASGTLTTWQNNGSPFGGAWTSSTAGTAGTPVNALALGDFDNDGDPDVLSGDSSGGLLAWQNNGSPFGAWSSLTVQTSGAAIHALQTTDDDRDGDRDVFSGSALDVAASEVQVWHNTHTHASTVFAAASHGVGSTGGNTVYGLVAADLDGDGNPDLASGEVNGALRVWQNDGTPFNGAWSGLQAGSTPAGEWLLSVKAGDMDGDGDLDLVTGNTGGAVRLWSNDGTPFTGTWPQTLVGTTGGGVNAVDLGDLDNDGDLDIASAQSVGATAEVIVWRNDGGTWTRFDVGTQDADMNTLVLADLDNDGDPDIVTSSSTSAAHGEVIVWQNNGLGSSWTRQDVGELNIQVFALGVGDLNGDGLPDIVSGDRNNNVIAWQNSGSPFSATWSIAQTLGSVPDPLRGLTIADLNADGLPDVLSGEGAGNGGGAVRLWTNNGTPFGGAWTATLIGITGDNANVLPVSDLDGDGDLDFGVGFSSDTDVPNEVSAWEQTGGQVTFQVTDTSPAIPSFIPNSTEDDVLRVVLTHNGQSGEATAEWAQVTFTFYRADCTTPLTTAEVNAIVDRLRVRHDNGNGAFQPNGNDVMIGDDTALTLDASGQYTMTFRDGDVLTQVAPGNSVTYWVSLVITANADVQNPNNLCLAFTPNADALVEGKYASGDAGLSQAEAGTFNTGDTPTAITLRTFKASTPSTGVPPWLPAALLFLALILKKYPHR